MQNVELNLYDKSDWTEGEWKTEPDKIQWQDEVTGYPCLIVRVKTIGTLCGYVGVNSKHPLFGIYDRSLKTEIIVHGDISYASYCSGIICHTVDDGEDDNIWWLGFDCNHACDIAPVDLAQKYGWRCPPHLKNVELRISKTLGMEYRNVAYVKEQCRLLAMQLKELENESTNCG